MTYTGISQYCKTIQDVQNVINYMKNKGLNILRLGFTPSWYATQNWPWTPAQVQYFLDNSPSDFVIIVNRNNYSPSTSADTTMKANITQATNDLIEIGQAWPGNPRVWIECVNEYTTTSDYQTVIKNFITALRNAGVTNTILQNWHGYNSWNPTNWGDSNVVQGVHLYFDQATTPEAKYNQAIGFMQYALDNGLRVCNTEVGASINESVYTAEQVLWMQTFLKWSYDRGLGNCVWMYHDLIDAPAYEALNLTYPTTPTPPPLPPEDPNNLAQIPYDWGSYDVLGYISHGLEPPQICFLDTTVLSPTGQPSMRLEPYAGAGSNPGREINVKGYSCKPGDRIIFKVWMKTQSSTTDNLTIQRGARLGIDYYGANGQIGGISGPTGAWPQTDEMTAANYVSWNTPEWTQKTMDVLVPATFLGQVPTGFIAWVQASLPTEPAFAWFSDSELTITPAQVITYLCPFDNQPFSAAQALIDHLKAEHQGQLGPLPEKWIMQSGPVEWRIISPG